MNTMNMPKTVDYLEMVRNRLVQQEMKKITDYRIAKVLGINHACMSRYMNRRGAMDDKTAVKVAKFLKIEPFSIIAAVNAERSPDPKDKVFWKSVYGDLYYRK